MKNLVLTAAIALVLVVSGTALWFGSAPEAQAVTCAGTSYKVSLPDLSSIAQDQLNVSTGRTGATDFGSCGDYSMATARYGVATGNASESYSKQHWSADPGNGTKNSCFARSGANDSCVVSGVTYYVYNVQTP